MNHNPDQLVEGTDTLSGADEDDMYKKWEREYHAIAGHVVEVCYGDVHSYPILTIKGMSISYIDHLFVLVFTRV